MTKNGSTYYYRYDDLPSLKLRKAGTGQRIYKDASTVKEFYLRSASGRELAVYDLNNGNKLKLINIFGNGGMVGRIDVTCNACPTEFEKRRRGSTPTYTKHYYTCPPKFRFLERRRVRDHLGSVRVDFGTNGSVSSAYAYYAYGQISQSYNNSTPNDKYKFTGKERDTETNYDYFGARYYDSDLGRWMSVDPSANKRFGLSPYNYVQNNPLNRFDPDGRTDWKALIQGVALGAASITAGVFAVTQMGAAVGGTAITLGTASPISVPAFLGGLGTLNLSVLGFAQSVVDVKLALETPDGMTSKQFNIVKNVVKGFGGNKVTQEGVSLILNTVGLKGVSKIGEGALQTLQVLVSTNASTESVIDFLKAAAEKERLEQEREEKEREKNQKNSN